MTNGRINKSAARAPILIFVVAFLVSLIFCFVVFPRIEQSYRLKVDPDGYGLLGQSLWKGQGLTFDRGGEGPTVRRGPIYPAFIALIMVLTSGWYPGGMWLAQSALHGTTCLLIFFLARKMFGPRPARAAGFVCAVYPALIWYAPRMYAETLMTFLLAAFLLIGISFVHRPTAVKAVGAAVLLGLLSLTKSTFLILVPVFPLALAAAGLKERRGLLLVPVVVPFLLIAPWTIRNYAVTGKTVLIHTGTSGMVRANIVAREFFRHPLSYSELWQISRDKVFEKFGHPIDFKVGNQDPLDDVTFFAALDEIRRDPALLVLKAVSGGAMFWYIGDTPSKSVILIVLKIPVLILAAAGAWIGLRRKNRLLLPAISIVLAFWMAHLPFASPGRLSTPVMPLLVLLAAPVFLKKKDSPPSASRDPD